MERGIKFWIKGWVRHPLLERVMIPMAQQLKLKGYIKIVTPNKIEAIITGDLESMELYMTEVIRMMEEHITLLDREFVYYQPIEEYVEWIDHEDQHAYENLFKDDL